jgi:hypothetical protein
MLAYLPARTVTLVAVGLALGVFACNVRSGPGPQAAVAAPAAQNRDGDAGEPPADIRAEITPDQAVNAPIDPQEASSASSKLSSPHRRGRFRER